MSRSDRPADLSDEDLRREVIRLRARQDDLIDLVVELGGWQKAEARRHATKLVERSDHLDDVEITNAMTRGFKR